VVFNGYDVTERKRVDSELRKVTCAVEQSPSVVVITDTEGNIEYANPKFTELTGYTFEEVSGENPRLLKSGLQPLGVYEDLWRTVVAGDEWRGELSNRRKDGEIYLELASISPIRNADGEITHFVKVGEDFTARARAEASLRQRNQELALLNKVGQELAAMLDLQDLVDQFLQAATETIGARGASVWLWDEEDEGWLVCRAAYHQGRSHSPINLRLQAGKGVAGWVAERGESVVIASVEDDSRFFSGIDKHTGFQTDSLIDVPLWVHGSVEGVLEVLNKQSGEFNEHDLVLVETLAASAAIAIDNARLVETLRRQTAELEAQNEELDAFVHTVAHDLKNPLNLIIGYSEVLKEDALTMSRRDLQNRLRRLAQHGHKMNDIVDELLLLAGVRQVEVELGPVDMASIVNEALDRLELLIEEHEAEIVYPDSWPTALGYSLWVEEVWVNYLSNAIKYGGKPPRVVCGAGPAMEPTRPVDDGEKTMIRFWVRDNGLGLTEGEQGRLFTPFTRLEQVRTKGHGLGLSIVRRIVEKLGGSVGVESQVGQGSLFFFTLPASSHPD
jgi:PAS domain S-box-containing protein